MSRYNNTELYSPNMINAFADYFKSVYSESDPSSCPSTNLELAPQLFVSCDSFSEHDIFLALKSSKNSFTAGPDGIPSFLLLDFANILVTPLSKYSTAY